MTSRPVHIYEVGARDGLQNEKVFFSTEQKLDLITRLIGAGIKRIEVASFAHPKVVPQMADAEAVIAALPDNRDVQYSGLVLNKRGYLRALATREGGRRGIDQIGTVCVMSETFSQKNQGMSIADTLRDTSEVLKLAKRDGISAQVTLSAVLGCPFEGEVPFDRVIDSAKRLADAEPDEIALADTIGAGVPSQVRDLVGRLREEIPDMKWRAHMHDTRNTGVANSWAAYEAGVDTIDASVAGLGGCPFAPRATGNVATEDVVYTLDRSGVATGVELDRLIDIAHWLEGILGRKTLARVSQAGGFPVPATAAE
ncbi:MAG: hydroxymethylglutaryl-CoA lyase [Alphaproteobacteria bacterium]|nr:MAG: hydroxymethylglutaryl-CoA lyase [Alphaproteobacteria bacterium]